MNLLHLCVLNGLHSVNKINEFDWIISVIDTGSRKLVDWGMSTAMTFGRAPVLCDI